MAVVVLAGCGGESAIEKAYAMCQDGVRDHLKAPATATFADLDDARVIEKDGDYQFISTVDSENEYSANLRSRFNCRVVKSGGRLELRSAHLIDD